MGTNLEETSIFNLIIETMTDYLIRVMRIEVTGTTRAGIVRAGKLQDDPTLKKINLLIHPGGSDWPDILNTKHEGPDMAGPTYAFGSGAYSAFWRRRFKVELQIFFPNENSRNNARTRSMTVLSRLHSALHNMPATIGPDSFGETAFQLQVIQMEIREGGGEGDFNWRGELIVEFFTELDPTQADTE